MAGCSSCDVTFDGMNPAYRRVLWIVIFINGTMFLAETGAGLAARSMALQADALDFLADTATYGISLWVIGRSVKLRASAALFKGLSLGLLGFWVLGSTLYRTLVLGAPEPTIMGTVGLLAFAANAVSALLLLRFREGDANVRSVWLCSRNDAIGNLAVIVAAGLVALTQSPWPDLLVAGLMACLFLNSAFKIIRQARSELGKADAEEARTKGSGQNPSEIADYQPSD